MCIKQIANIYESNEIVPIVTSETYTFYSTKKQTYIDIYIIQNDYQPTEITHLTL